MCECYKEKIDSEENDYIKKAIHFHCRCMYVLLCKDHPYGGNFNYQMVERKRLCANGLSHEICQFCFNVRYLLNFTCFKICMENIPLSFANELVTICQYFKSVKECEPFFLYNKGSNYIEISLDNPDEPNTLVNTDYVYISP